MIHISPKYQVEITEESLKEVAESIEYARLTTAKHWDSFMGSLREVITEFMPGDNDELLQRIEEYLDHCVQVSSKSACEGQMALTNMALWVQDSDIDDEERERRDKLATAALKAAEQRAQSFTSPEDLIKATAEWNWEGSADEVDTFVAMESGHLPDKIKDVLTETIGKLFKGVIPEGAEIKILGAKQVNGDLSETVDPGSITMEVTVDEEPKPSSPILDALIGHLSIPKKEEEDEKNEEK